MVFGGNKKQKEAEVGRVGLKLNWRSPSCEQQCSS